MLVDTAVRYPSNFEVDAAAFYLLAAMLIFAPLIWGANLPLPLLILELSSVGLLLYVAHKPGFRSQLPLSLQLALLVLLLLPLAQLIPIPNGLWSLLPGRGYYAQALQEVPGPATTTRPITLVPWATERAGLAILPPIMVFLVTVSLSSQHLQRLIYLFLGIATFQAILGLIQYGDVPDSLFRLGNPYMDGNAFGTYINRNHLAGLLEMALPVGLALLTATVGHAPRPADHARRGLRQRLATLTTLRVNVAFVYGTISIALLLGLTFTRSRMGIAMAMLGILLCILAFTRRLGGWNVYGLAGTVTAAGIGLATLIGLAPILTRFADDPLGDARWSIASAALHAAGEFFPLGSGNGTFTQIFWRFYPPQIQFDGIIDRAHNDYLEWIVEGGIVILGLLAIFLFGYVRQWSKVWQRGSWPTFRFVQVGAGISVLVMSVHSFVDFNLHIPANAIFFALLAAAFMHTPLSEPDEQQSNEPQRPRRHKKRPHRHRLDEPMHEARSRTIPSENQINPFSE